MRKELLGALLLSMLGSLSAFQEDNTFLKQDSLKEWKCSKGAALMKEGLEVTSEKFVLVRRYLPVDQLSSKRVVMEVEVKGEIEPLGKRSSGGRFGLIYKDSKGKSFYPGVPLPKGKFPWTKIRMEQLLPADLQSINIELGAENAKGKFVYRNLKFTAEETVLDFRNAMNMGFADEKEHDGKGGWSDQGPDNDARGIPIRQNYKGFPFHVIHPSQNGGKSIVLFKSVRSPYGVREFEVDLSKGHAVGPYLYLLHTTTWGDKDLTTIGVVEVIGKNGVTRSFPIRFNQDVGGWWLPRRKTNAVPLVTWGNKACSHVGVYVSLFELAKDFGEVAKVRFRSNGTGATWHLLAATLTPNIYEYPADEHIVIREGKDWRPMPGRKDPGVIPGSALDLSGQLPWKSVDQTGRVVVNAKGQLEFEKEPGKPVHFLTASDVPASDAWSDSDALKTHQDIEAHCLELRRQGYNMIRLSSPNIFLTYMNGYKIKKEFELNPKNLDRFDYLIYCMKKYGIYLNLGCMSAWGWQPGTPWDGKPKPAIRKYAFTIYFSDEARKHWEKGFMNLITRVNPYTKTRLIDDPVLALCLCLNEQESVLFKGQGGPHLEYARPAWIQYLKKAYNGDFAKLRKTWGDLPENIRSFEDLPVFTGSDMVSYSTPRSRDFVRFSIQAERETRDYYIRTLRKNGVKCLISSANMGLDFRYILLRSKYDAVTINGYHSHPSGEFLLAGSGQNDPSSAIERSGRHMRGFASLHLYGKPILNTEHAMPFWNGYRYEQGLLVGAYAALQDFSGLTAFSGPVSRVGNEKPMRSFALSKDPVAKATEFITACAFARGDVRMADPLVRLRVDDSMISAKNVDQDGINSEQQKLAFVTRIAADVDQNKPVLKNEISIPAVGGSRVVLHQGGMFQNTEDADPASYKADGVVAELKKKGLLAKMNRTNISKGIFESSTGEIFMDTDRKFLSVNTPRLQGFCALAGTTAKTDDFSLDSISERGTVTVMSVDGKTSIRDSERLVLVYATNALNTDMEFASKNHAIRLKLGHWPPLLKTGRISFTLKNKNAEKLRLYALRFDGSRIEEIPLKKSAGTLSGTIDTVKIKEGVPFFFELCAR